MTIQQEQLQVTQLFHQAAHEVLRLKQAISRSRCDDRHFGSALAVLETLPLASDEFAVAQSRVRNAERATSNGELGAAAYEVTLLANWLKGKADA